MSQISLVHETVISATRRIYSSAVSDIETFGGVLPHILLSSPRFLLGFIIHRNCIELITNRSHVTHVQGLAAAPDVVGVGTAFNISRCVLLTQASGAIVVL